MTSPSPVSGTPQPLTARIQTLAERLEGIAYDENTSACDGVIADLGDIGPAVAALEAERDTDKRLLREGLALMREATALEASLRATVSSQQDEIARLRGLAAKAGEFFTMPPGWFAAPHKAQEALRLLASEFKAAATPGEPSHE